MQSFGVFVAILIAIAFGYFWADFQGQKKILRRVREATRQVRGRPRNLSDSHYYGALTSLLKDQPDEALDAFVSSMEVNSDTLEMHLALASLLRRRGEFARAVRVHENLLTRPGLPRDSIHAVQLELANDYWRSGLLDRAETLLKELIGVSDVNRGARWQACAYLVEIYQELGDWLPALDFADQLTAKKFAPEADFWKQLQAQFSCELADEAIRKGHSEVAMTKARAALAYDSQCVRASLLMAQLAIENEDWNSALIALKQVPIQDSDYISEVIQPFVECIEDTKILEIELIHLFRSYHSLDALMALTLLPLEPDISQIKRFWQEAIEELDSLKSERSLFRHLLLENNDTDFSKSLGIITQYIAEKSRYLCKQCGHVSFELEWRCPKCHSWATLKKTA